MNPEMEIVTMSIICKKGDGEALAEDMMQSDIAQRGIYSMGADFREAKRWEENEVMSQTPPEILKEYFGDE
jgi:hypothetical protein